MKAEKLFKRLKKASKGKKVALPSPREVKNHVSDFLWLTIVDQRLRDFFREKLINDVFEEQKNPRKKAIKTFSRVLYSVKNDYSSTVDSCDLAYSLAYALSFCYTTDRYNQFIEEFKNEYL